jgi:hypothetical protein
VLVDLGQSAVWRGNKRTGTRRFALYSPKHPAIILFGKPLAMMMTDHEIRAAIDNRQIVLDPPDLARIEPASYDARVGRWAFASSSKEKIDLSQKGVLVIEPGEFAVLETKEYMELDSQTAANWGFVRNTRDGGFRCS